MEISIDESVWTDERICEWSKLFYDAENLEDVVDRLAIMKTNHDDGEFIEGFGIPLINGKKPYFCLNDNEVQDSINIRNQEESVDVDVEEITY